jgi:hypothetical protein
MEKKSISIEQVLYLVILGVALWMRLLHLGSVPLNEVEAGWALRAFHVSSGGAVNTGSQPAYVLLTGLLFTLFGSSDTLARLLPALSGALLVLLPYWQRQRIGQPAALLFALALAFDPGLVSLSRQAGGPMMALAFTLLALSYWLKNKPICAGILAGLSLLSGTAAIFGWLALALLWAVLQITSKISMEIDKDQLRTATLAAAVTLVLVGTLFLRFPQGISGIGAALWGFLQGFVRFSGVPMVELALALLVYQPLALLFAAFGWFSAEGTDPGTRSALKYGLLVTFLLALLYPAREMADLAWTLVPLWGLATVGLQRILPRQTELRSPVLWSEASLTIVLIVLFWINFAAVSKIHPISLPQAWESLVHFKISDLGLLDLGTQNYLARVAVLALVPLLVYLSMVLVGLGWDIPDARRGFLLGLIISLCAYTFSVSWAASQLPERPPNELWTSGGAPGNIREIIDTIGDFAEWTNGQRQTIDAVYEINSPALEWELRGFPEAVFSDQVSPTDFPSVVITPALGYEPRLEQAYRGQSFVLQKYRQWVSWPPDFLTWFVYRNIPPIPDEAILWVRADLFPGSDTSLTEPADMLELTPADQ